jgi:hypothetical protein
MGKTLCIAISVLLTGVAASGLSCASEPGVNIEADSITIGFEDNTFLHLSQQFPLFEEISGEAMRIVQSGKTKGSHLNDEEVAAAKYGSKYVQLDFAQPISLQHYAEITSAVVLLTKKEPALGGYGVWSSIEGNIFIKSVTPDCPGSSWSQAESNAVGLEELVNQLR